ncbi:protein-(glutamine-N5) methyltransferase, release factor-specific [Halothece sp. PCC 7418]|uniref:peptide chain release factor N(5)-glutamine methyltransferase n=1 Tax=Halothece sp. (strain PCC 7418) TaxID=65093 RepID=UPI0002A06892|nr:peptide chain release factor N(5)-glutamine methyltransferase [Halothece sp. PCC 7418]AFZ44525.1 protein-(glutamine-N5) methyltransferase, release factor-specific [Halothece sp. PCC 7418]
MVSGLELARWREESIDRAIALSIPPQEVDWLLQSLAGLSSLSLRLESYKTDAEIPLPIPFSELKQLWEKRLQDRIPVQYLVGETPWRDLMLKVSPAVLIPRPETEILVELALNYGADLFSRGHWVDLGTGSGAIALSLAKALPNAKIHAVDDSPEALAIAQENAKNLGLVNQIEFHQGSWFSPLSHLQGKISVMVSNPPYIPTATLAELQPEVRQHEPLTALDGGNDGLDAIRHLVNTAPQFLHSGGLWLVEMEARQGDAVKALLTENGHYHPIAIHKDLAGIERFALAYVRKSVSDH